MENKTELITLPNKHLRNTSTKVGLITPQIKSIIENMKNTTLKWESSRDHEVGVALAAIQIDVPLRIIIVRRDIEDKADHTFDVFINAEITKSEGEIVEDYEGCLSIKDIYGKVPRYNRVKIKALNENGEQFRVTAEGFLARIFQHEIDHTKGILFIDHIKDDESAFYKLEKDGDLTEMDYDNVKKNNILW